MERSFAKSVSRHSIFAADDGRHSRSTVRVILKDLFCGTLRFAPLKATKGCDSPEHSRDDSENLARRYRPEFTVWTSAYNAALSGVLASKVHEMEGFSPNYVNVSPSCAERL